MPAPSGKFDAHRTKGSMAVEHLLDPGLLQQLQPDLAAGGEGGDRVAQAVERHLADDRDRRRVEELGDVAAGDREPDEEAALAVEQEARGAGRAAAEEGAARVAR